MRITRDIADAVLVEDSPKPKRLKPNLFLFTRSNAVGFHIIVSFYRWYWPLVSLQFWRFGLDLFLPYPTIKFV